MLNENPNYDGVTFGNDNDEPVFWIWDENKWGKSNEGLVCLVFECDDHDKTYEETKTKRCFPWILQKLLYGAGRNSMFKDPDGNTILIL